VETVLSLFSALGLSSAAGLNAYLPLLVVALLARFTNLVTLSEPWDMLTNWWVIGTLAVLLIIETVVDKVPAADTVNDIINTVIRPAAGAIVFAANSGSLGEVHPVLALICGLVIAGGVHAVKATARPVVTATTAGTGNWVVSTVEDVVSFVTSVLSIVVPVLVAAIAVILVFWVGWRLSHRRLRRAG
jgi:hypothetical protein